MLKISNTFSLDESELQFSFIRATGPGGQNVNKVATAVQLRFNLMKSALPDDFKQRCQQLIGNKLTTEGELVITARRFRTQTQNRRDAIARLIHLLQRASVKPKKRIKTKPSKKAKEKRLANKKRQSQKKQQRGRISDL